MTAVRFTSKKPLVPTLIGLSVAAALGLTMPGEAAAQSRPTLVRDIDAPALQPFRASVGITLTYLNTQVLVTTVPAGKRLVVEYVSWNSAGPAATQVVFAGLRVGEFGPFQQNFQINPPHASISSAFTLQDGSMPVKIYFEAGEQVWASVSGTSNSINATIQIQGFLITP